MSSTATPLDVEVSPCERLEALHAEIGELTGQRNAIDARLVEIVAEIDGDGLWGATGARSITSLVAWKTGVSPRNAEVMVAVAHRIEEFPRCAEAMREGRLSLDQVGWSPSMPPTARMSITPSSLQVPRSPSCGRR